MLQMTIVLLGWNCCCANRYRKTVAQQNTLAYPCIPFGNYRIHLRQPNLCTCSLQNYIRYRSFESYHELLFLYYITTLYFSLDKNLTIVVVDNRVQRLFFLANQYFRRMSFIVRPIVEPIVHLIGNQSIFRKLKACAMLCRRIGCNGT